MNKYIKNGIPAQSEKNILGYEKIGKLLKMYAVPSIISILVNALYNIVDQVFIGWGVGYLANGATNVVFPITIVFASFALMFGDGSAAYLSLKLGEGNKEDAAKGVGNGILMSVVISIIFTVFVLLSLPWLLNVFGCTPNLEQYAKDYGYIIAIGLPFSMVGTTINSVIRADGSPKYAMITMLTGAVLNVILDPIFIFGFHMGVKGAALATIISQIISFLLNSADLCLMKPGGLSVTEAAVKKLPMAFINAVAGCEQYNIEYFVKKGGAVSSDSPEELTDQCIRLLQSERKLQEMENALREYRRAEGAKQIFETMELLNTEKIYWKDTAYVERESDGLPQVPAGQVKYTRV